MIDIKGLDKREVLAALVNKGRPMGMGVIHHRPVKPEDVEPFLAVGRIDYCFGVPIKARLDGDEFNELLYDRDQGSGHAKRVIDGLRGK